MPSHCSATLSGTWSRNAKSIGDHICLAQQIWTLYCVHKRKIAYFGCVIYNQEITCCVCFCPLTAPRPPRPNALWSPGGFAAWCSINCKLLLGYHWEKSWLETTSRTCSSELKWPPLGSANGPSRGLIVPFHSCFSVAKQQITINVQRLMEMSFSEGFSAPWLKYSKPKPLN